MLKQFIHQVLFRFCDCIHVDRYCIKSTVSIYIYIHIWWLYRRDQTKWSICSKHVITLIFVSISKNIVRHKCFVIVLILCYIPMSIIKLLISVIVIKAGFVIIVSLVNISCRSIHIKIALRFDLYMLFSNRYRNENLTYLWCVVCYKDKIQLL